MKLRVKSFILAVIVSVLFIAAKNIYSCDLSAHMDKGIYRAAKLGSVERLYIGSSMFRRGIDINEAVGLSDSSFILAYNGFDPVNEYLVLDCLLKNGLVIKNLYIDMYAYSAAGESWLAESRMFFDSPMSLKINTAHSIMHSNRTDILPSLWELFMSSGNDIFMLWPMYKRLAAGLYYKGGAAKESSIPGTNREMLAMTPVPDTGTQSLNHGQKDAVARIISICRSNDIHLTFIETPKYYDVIDNNTYQSLMLDYFALLKNNGAECIVSSSLLDALNMKPDSTVRSYNFPHDDALMFIDHIHLSSLGSRIFTSILCSELQQEITAGGFVY